MDFISSVGLHPVVVDLTQSASLMIRCGILRAYMTIVEEKYLLYPLPAMMAMMMPNEQDCITTNITYCHIAIRHMMLSNNMQLLVDFQLSSSSEGELLLYPFFAFIMHAINHPVPLFQFYALQTLEAWLARIQSITTITTTTTSYEKMLSKLFRIIASVLTKLWIHPVKQINHLVPSIYQKLVQTITHLVKSTTALLDNLTNDDANGDQAILPDLLREVLRMPVRHRGKYQALNALLPHITAAACFAIQPNFMETLIAAIEYRDIASSVSGFLGTLLSQLYIDEAIENQLDSVRMLWIPAVCDGLCSTNRKLRLYIADYLLAEVFRVDRLCVPAMLQYIRAHIDRKEGIEKQLVIGSHQLWGIMNIILHARLVGMSGVETMLEESLVGDDESGMVTASEFILSCISADSELRLVSLTALVATSRTAAPMDQVDLDILKKCLRYSLKSTDADHCNKVTRIVKAFTTRVRESARVAQRDLKKIEKQLKHLKASSKSSDTKEDANNFAVNSTEDRDDEPNASIALYSHDRSLDATRYRNVIQDSFDALLWLKTELLGNLYPDSVPDREVMALELLNTIIDAMGIEAEQLKPLFDIHMVRTLITMLTSSWDRSRRSVADILLKFPYPLSGFTTLLDARCLLSRSITLACSAKLRESDSGALMIRNLYLIYSMSLRWDMRLRLEGGMAIAQLFTAIQAKDSKECCCALFINELCDTWSSTLIELREVFSSYVLQSSFQHTSTHIAHSSPSIEDKRIDEANQQDGPSSSSSSVATFPLCHGLLASIRYCLVETHKVGLITGTIDNTNMNRLDVWRPILHRILQACFDSLTLSMTVVAEAGDKIDHFMQKEELSLSQIGDSSLMINTKGPVIVGCSLTAAGISASSGRINMSASYVNTNSSMGKSSSDDNDGFDDESASSQRAVVAAWLLVKETSALLSCLVSISSEVMHMSSSSKGISTEFVRDDDTSLLSLSDLSRIGSTILDALGRLKHMGAIFEAQVALQTISSTLLK